MALEPRPYGAPQVQLVPMTQLAEAIDSEDDWTGITDPVARRKRQNRLNVRAHRRRKARESRIQLDLVAGPIQSETSVPCWVENRQTVSRLPISVATEFKKMRKPLIPSSDILSVTTRRQGQGGIIFPLSADHLIVLLQYNVLRACMANRSILSSFFSTPTVTACSSSELHVFPRPQNDKVLPKSLQPTHLQRTVPHEDWIDIIPHPVWRDNVIRAIGTFDEDQLWSDTIGGLFEGFPHSEVEQRGVIVWSPPWDITGWELSEGFLRNWSWSMENCEDILEVTNGWRRQRGEEPLTMSSCRVKYHSSVLK